MTGTAFRYFQLNIATHHRHFLRALWCELNGRKLLSKDLHPRDNKPYFVDELIKKSDPFSCRNLAFMNKTSHYLHSPLLQLKRKALAIKSTIREVVITFQNDQVATASRSNQNLLGTSVGSQVKHLMKAFLRII